MKRIIAVLLAAIMLFGITALADEPDGYIATGGWITDQQTYYGTWQQAYGQILNNHSGLIHAYQSRTLSYYDNGRYVQVPCKPITLMDITSDGIPELVFMEAATGVRGDLYIYSSNGSETRCILYVPGITRLGYDDAGQGFDVYLSSAGGGTLILEYYEYEWPWILQLARNALGQYTPQSYLRATYDNSGEGNDRFYRNGSPVSLNDYNSALETMRNGRIMTLSSYSFDDTSRYGFALTWEDAISVMNGYNTPTAVPPSGRNSGEIYGLAIQKLATRKGPGTQYEEGGTYSVKGQQIRILAKAWDKRNDIWWVKCEIPYNGEKRILWTGYKRFDSSTLPLDIIPEETGW